MLKWIYLSRNLIREGLIKWNLRCMKLGGNNMIIIFYMFKIFEIIFK